jgi:heterodisulfide reductase subunit C2
MQHTPLSPDFDFLDKLESAGPFHATECFQCRKCTNGCPASFAMDLYPDQVIRLALLGQKEEVLRSKTIWVCASCETCTTRCPNGVHIAEIMDYFKELAVQEGIPTPQPQVVALHQTFLDNVRLTGRIFEGGLLPAYLLRSGQLRDKLDKGTWRDDALLGWKLFRKGRLPVFPKFIKGRDEVKAILRPSKSTGNKS